MLLTLALRRLLNIIHLKIFFICIFTLGSRKFKRPSIFLLEMPLLCDDMVMPGPKQYRRQPETNGDVQRFR